MPRRCGLLDGGSCGDGQCQSAECGDAYEPNDTVETATAFNPGSPLVGIVACADEDWYRFNVAAGTPFIVDVTHLHEEGDIDITLYQGEETIGQSLSVTDNESVGVPGSANMGGDFELKVKRLGVMDEYSAMTSMLCSIHRLNCVPATMTVPKGLHLRAVR